MAWSLLHLVRHRAAVTRRPHLRHDGLAQRGVDRQVAVSWLTPCRLRSGKSHLIIDRDTKYVDGFRHTLEAAGLKIVRCPPRSAMQRLCRTLRSLNQGRMCERLVFLSERHLRTTIATFGDYYRRRRNHQGIQNKLIERRRGSPRWPHPLPNELGGLLHYYYRKPRESPLFQGQPSFLHYRCDPVTPFQFSQFVVRSNPCVP